MLVRGVCGVPSRSYSNSEMARLMGSFIGEAAHSAGAAAARAAGPFPAINAWETEQAFHVEAETPGLRMTDLDISLLENTLTISGGREWTPEEGASVHRRERPEGRFSRSIRLGADIEGSKVSASLENGVLHITLPKGEAARARKIEVREVGRG